MFRHHRKSHHHDFLSGDSGANILIGGDGNDTLGGDGANDSLYGGTGNDVASFLTGATAAATLTLPGGGTGTLTVSGLGTDSITSIEGIQGTSAYGDSLTGNASSNTLLGDGGNDTLIPNTLGSAGQAGDSMAGGAGDDLFRIENAVFESIDGGIGN